MRKFILSLAVAAAALAPMSVNAESETDNTHRVYCELLGVSKFLSNKINVTVDFGQERKLMETNKDSYLVDADGKKITFNSMVDAMNYMGERGWRFVQAYVISNGNQNIYHWLLYKDISEGQTITEGMTTGKDVRQAKEADKKEKKTKEIKDDIY